jgi:hypothetical protein
MFRNFEIYLENNCFNYAVSAENYATETSGDIFNIFYTMESFHLQSSSITQAYVRKVINVSKLD